MSIPALALFGMLVEDMPSPDRLFRTHGPFTHLTFPPEKVLPF